MKLAYYAHPVTMYGTMRESDVIYDLMQAGFVVLNPNNPATALEYRLAKAYNDKTAMEVFYRMIDRCDVVVFESFPDNMIGSGVMLEIQYARQQKKPVFEVPHPAVVQERALTREETVQRNKTTKGLA